MGLHQLHQAQGCHWTHPQAGFEGLDRCLHQRADLGRNCVVDQDVETPVQGSGGGHQLVQLLGIADIVLQGCAVAPKTLANGFDGLLTFGHCPTDSDDPDTTPGQGKGNALAHALAGAGNEGYLLS